MCNKKDDREGKKGKIYVLPYMWHDPVGDRPVYKDEYGDIVSIAISEDGLSLESHLSTNKSFSKRDMGINSNSPKHDKYKKYYPGGYELIWLDNFEDLPEEVEQACKDRYGEKEDAKVQHV